MYKPSIASLFILSAMHRDASAFAPSLTKLHGSHLRLKTSEQSRLDNESKNEEKGDDKQLQIDASTDDVARIFEEINGIEGLPDPEASLDEHEIMNSIGNEIAIKEFVNIINEKDRNIDIPVEEFFDGWGLFEQLMGKAMDTVEDAALMYRRGNAESNNLLRQDELDADALSE